jgi:DNA-binding GntR family transcriptional regulator
MFRSLDLSPTPEALTRYIDRDRYFHWRLVEISGNRYLAHAIDSVNLMIFTYQHGLPARPPKETIREHWAILDALRRRDPEASEAAMRLHMRRSVERMDKEADMEEAQASVVSRDTFGGS